MLKPKGSTWRTNKSQGGGCLYDYAIHVIDLLNYVVGRPVAVGGSIMNRIFSRDVEDEIYASLFYENGMTGQIAANWSDESQRKMSTKVTVWGTNGKVVADRQELQVYIRESAGLKETLSRGWNVRNTTDLTESVWFYLRGEEYSAQIDHFVQTIKAGRSETHSSFRSAVDADLVAFAIASDAQGKRTATAMGESTVVPEQRTAGFWNTIWRAKTRNLSA